MAELAQLAIKPFLRPAEGKIKPPGSKSITNRALVCAALAEGESVLAHTLDSQDTQVMIAALRQLGLRVDVDLSTAKIAVGGCGGRIGARDAEIFVGNSGTTVRFLTAMLALGNGDFVLDGTARMRERPIQDLLDAIASLGVKVRSIPGTGCPPVELQARGLSGGSVRIRGDISSQFLSGLLLAAPYAGSPLRISIEGELVSKPYVQMTLAVMKEFGVEVQTQGLSEFYVEAPKRYRGREFAIEPDASAASYFWAAAAITQGQVTVEGLNRQSLQGDVAFCECLAQMGCEVHYEETGTTVIGKPLRGIEVDMNAISDTVQTLGATALFAEGPTTIRGVGHIRHKETDRIGDLATELRKLGATVEVWEDGMRITPGRLCGAIIDTYDDHRMAMSLALVGLVQPGVVINDPGCTAKTYPQYFEDLEKLRR